jgi:1,4-dihydroxy-2-naphthoate octaprenyltransferase
MATFKALLGPMRAPFLVLNPACVAVGVGTAYWQTQRLNGWHVLLVLIGAVSAHICVNAFNEYFDFKTGLDAKTKRTPFSGGSGTLQARPEMERAVLVLSWTTLGVAAAIGVYFVWLWGWLLLPLGALGLFLLVTYTSWWTNHPLLCLIAPGLGFGVLMVMGTHFALTGEYSWTAFVASLVPTFLVSNLLLLNQFPDVDADREVGRKNYPITLGLKRSSQLYGSLLLLTYLSILAGVILGLLPLFSLLALLTAVLSWRVYQGVRQNTENIPGLVPFMGMNVVITISTPILLAIGLFIG